MPFIWKNSRVCSNSKQSLVACGLYGNIVSVQESQTSRAFVNYLILWDNYLCGLYFTRDEFDVVPQTTTTNAFRKRFDMHIQKKKQAVERKETLLAFWRNLDKEQIRHHYDAVLVRNLVPVSNISEETKLQITMFDQATIIKKEHVQNPSCNQTNKLPAKGSRVCSVHNSTVLAGLFGTVTSSNCMHGTTTFNILWDGYFASINYSIDDFVVNEFAQLTEDGKDPNDSLTSLALESATKFEESLVPIQTKMYKQGTAKVVFDNSRRPGHVTFDF